MPWLARKCRLYGASQVVPCHKVAYRRHSSTPLNEFLAIVLESGAGPRVHRSLSKGANEIYFSTVVQLSLLLSVFDARNLTRGLRQALANGAEESTLEVPNIPAFDILLGMLKAIRNQTSYFNWRLLLEAVHLKTFLSCRVQSRATYPLLFCKAV